MRYYYGDRNYLRLLDEAEFWKHQEKEHTVVIREIVPNLEPQFVQALEKFQLEFAKTRAAVVRYIELVGRSSNFINPMLQQEILNIIIFSIQQSKQFIALLNRMEAESSAVKNDMIAKTVIDHIRRESEYFIGIAQTIYNTPL